MAAETLPELDPSSFRMSVGTAVTLLPTDLATGLLDAEVTYWLDGPGGMIIVGAQTSAATAALCAGQQVWVAGHEAEHGELVVFEALAQRASRQVATVLTLTGVVPIAHEHRRRAVRAMTRHPVRLTFANGTAADGIALDFSRAGCHVSLDYVDVAGPIGSTADLQIALPGNEDFSLTGDVIRIPGTREVALRFHLADIDLAAIDRLVYATVMRQRQH
jgi:hypothetical protein